MRWKHQQNSIDFHNQAKEKYNQIYLLAKISTSCDGWRDKNERMFYSLHIQCGHAGVCVVVFRWVNSPRLCRNGLLRFTGVCLILYTIHIWHYLGEVVKGRSRETVQVLLVSSEETKDTWDPLSNRCVRSCTGTVCSRCRVWPRTSRWSGWCRARPRRSWWCRCGQREPGTGPRHSVGSTRPRAPVWSHSPPAGRTEASSPPHPAEDQTKTELCVNLRILLVLSGTCFGSTCQYSVLWYIVLQNETSYETRDAIERFKTLFSESDILGVAGGSCDVNTAFDIFNYTCSFILNSIATLRARGKTKSDPWLNEDTCVLRRACRWKKDKIQVSYSILQDALVTYQNAVKAAKMN